MGYRVDNAYEEILNQFRDRPNILTTIACLLAPFEEIDSMLVSLATERKISVAVGIWLREIGSLVGVDWPAEYIPDDNIFTFKAVGDPDDINKGFADNPATFGGYFQSLDGVHYPDAALVDDETFRIFVRAKARATDAEPSLPSVARFLVEAFDLDPADFDVVTAGSRYVEVIFADTAPTVIKYATQALCPRAAGVSVYVR